MELFKLGIRAAQEGLAKGEFSSVELVQSVIDRVHEKNGEIGAYLTFDEEGARALARESDARRAAGRPLGDFDGIPIAIKDLINVKGQPCTCASKILKGYVSPYDATVIRNLKAGGFIPAGRVNMDEFAMTVSLYSTGSRINEFSAPFFMLKTENGVPTSLKEFKTNYESSGFSCTSTAE